MMQHSINRIIREMFSTSYSKEEKLWRGLEIPPLYNPKISLAQALLNSMSMFGSKIAQISDNNGIRMTFNDIQIKTIRAAKNLQALGCKKNEMFMTMARNSHHLAPIIFASIAIGCPINALDPSFGKSEVVHMMKITKPTVVFCDLSCCELIEKSLQELKIQARIFTFGGKSSRSEPVECLFEETHKDNQFIPVAVNGPNDTAMIVCSSGTTGLPKGVCLSHAAILDYMPRYCHEMSHVMLSFSSLYWASGVICLLKGTLCGATRIITTDIFNAKLQIRLIEQYKVTFLMNAPHQSVLMMKCDGFKAADLSSLKFLLVGGSKVPHHVKTELSPRIPNGIVVPAYGLSETVGPFSFDVSTVIEKDCVGQLIPGCCVKIIDEDGNRCGVNVDGEICVKMNYTFLGYHNNQQATDAMFDSEGFIVTGDIGHFDEDGDLFVTGRRKELMKYYNFPIVPSEIDAYLAESPDIQSACVVGIPDSMGDLPAAAVVRNNGSNISEEEVYNLVAGHFADHYKLRGGVFFVDSLPLTPSGKVLMRKVQEMAIKLFNSRLNV